MTLTEILLRLGAAAGFSFLLGLDREEKQKPFGLRTHMLLCIGTAAFTLILMEVTYGMDPRPELIQTDPARVVEAIVNSIGLLGAGALIRARTHIIGATTGAGIWVTGSIGLACGFGLYWHAAIITAFALFIVRGLLPVDEWLSKKNDASDS